MQLFSVARLPPDEASAAMELLVEEKDSSYVFDLMWLEHGETPEALQPYTILSLALVEILPYAPSNFHPPPVSGWQRHCFPGAR